MSAKLDALKLADDLGAKLVYGGRGRRFEATAEAPEGYRWAEGPHELIAVGNPHPLTGKYPPQASLWADLLDRMKSGVEMCKPTCEWCFG